MTSFSFRMQIVLDASQFASLSSAPNITNRLSGISFRIDGASTNIVFSGFSSIRVTLSVTTKGPDNLSPIFADNVGANPIAIYNGSGTLGGNYVPGSNPQPFGPAIPVLTPFSYAPAQGNLLLDIRAVGLEALDMARWTPKTSSATPSPESLPAQVRRSPARQTRSAS